MKSFPRRAIAVAALTVALAGSCVEAAPALAKTSTPVASVHEKSAVPTPEVFFDDFLELWEHSIASYGAGSLFSWLHWPFFPPYGKPPVVHHPYPPGPPTWVPPVTPPPHPVPPPHPAPPHPVPKPPKH